MRKIAILSSLSSITTALLKTIRPGDGTEIVAVANKEEPNYPLEVAPGEVRYMPRRSGPPPPPSVDGINIDGRSSAKRNKPCAPHNYQKDPTGTWICTNCGQLLRS